MREKELRLALVCSGGVSLAIYIHGVTKEILKLVRASRAYHARPNNRDESASGPRATAWPPGQVIDTEQIYFELLQAIGQHLDLRVIVDVIAGASAGGINAVYLARALAHDLPYEDLRESWLSQADIRKLSANESRPGPINRWVLKPLVRFIARYVFRGRLNAAELSRKFSSLMQLRRLRPPMDGEKLLAAIYDALYAMGGPHRTGASLMPATQRLELFVTVTDFYGYLKRIPMYDPPMIEEREHRHVLGFSYLRRVSGAESSEFTLEDTPALAFTARATSSFPGAFQPAQLCEVDRLMVRRGRVWTHRRKFLESKFEPYRLAGADPERAAFLDGSVLDNKPFAAAIRSIQGRPAARQVDRRLLYIDPAPEHLQPSASGGVPSLFRTLRASLSDIPRNEPIHSDITWVEGFNKRVRRTKTIIEAARPDIDRLVAAVTKGRLGKRRLTARQIGQWRDQANEFAVSEAGFAYEGYVRLKLAGTVEFTAKLVGNFCRLRAQAPEREGIEQTLLAWAAARGVHFPDPHVARPPVGRGEMPVWAVFLHQFDLDFRRRRLRFVIQGLNRLYGLISGPDHEATTRALDSLKRDFYQLLEQLQIYHAAGFPSRQASAELRAIFCNADIADAAAFAREHDAAIAAAFATLAEEMDLPGLNQKVDAVLVLMDEQIENEVARRQMLTDYLGFAFWDILTFSITNWRELGEFDEIRISRISPDDAKSLPSGQAGKNQAGTPLKGVALRHFGAFFSRADRENDYLWGRLHAVERLIDLLCQAAELEDADRALNPMALKKRAFGVILDTEARHLPRCDKLVKALRAKIDALPDGPATGQSTSDQSTSDKT